MHDERDDREEQQQVDEQTSALEHYEATKPHHNQNNCKNEKHGTALLSCFKIRARREELLVRDADEAERCLGSEEMRVFLRRQILDTTAGDRRDQHNFIAVLESVRVAA